MIESAGETFGQWLRRKRKEKRFTQESLAGAAGNICTSAYISSLEREQEVGKSGRPTRPDVSIVDALAKALNEPVSVARKKAGYDPAIGGNPSVAPEPDSIEEALKNAMFFDQKGLSPEDIEKIRPLLEVVDREVDRLKKDDK